MTAPTPVTCQVYVQGDRLEDGSDLAAGVPTVLSGLHLTWGRGTTVDQPDTATAAFTVEDRAGDQAFARLVALGKTVDITATGTTWADPGTWTFDDPTWDATPLGPASHPGRPAAGDRVIDYHCATAVEAAPGGGRRLRTRATTGGPISVDIPPRALAPPSAPTAWDDIPTPQPGQGWQQRIGAGWAAPGAVLRVGALRFDTPWTTAPPVQWPDTMPAWDPAAGPWLQDYTPPEAAAGQWQGIRVAANPAGYTWQAVPADVTWSTAPPAWTWETMAGFVLDDVDVAAPGGGSAREVLIFSGRITDADAHWDEGVGSALVEVTAADMSAELSNRDVGAEPWPAERLDARARRILTAAGRTDVTLYADPRPAAHTVTRMDVDRQQVYPMLADLATSVDAVLWTAAHSTTGAYLWIEDMQHRTPGEVLALVDGLVVIIPTAEGSITLSACDVDLEPFHWIQSNSDTATRCVVDWQDQTTTPDPTGRSAAVVLTDLEDPQGLYGVRRVQVTSQVTTESDALDVAAGVLSRLGPAATPWRVAGVTWHVEPDAGADAVATALAMLDGTTRIGAPVRLVDLPTWSPVTGSASGYLEGGAYDYTDGAWTLALVLSAGAGVGASVTWLDLDPAWTWQQFDPAIRWLDLFGVGANSGGTRP